MTDNRTTELLRKLLDENGIEWKSGRTNENNTSWDVGDLRVTAKELSDGTLLMYQYSRKHLTPEQTIAATLGEQIIRCRDCKYYHDGTTNGRRYVEPHCLAIGELAYGALFEVDEDCFCSWGERKEVD